MPHNAQRLAVDRDFRQILYVAKVDPDLRALLQPVSLHIDRLCVGACSGEVLDACVLAVTPRHELVERNRWGCSTIWLEAHLPRTIRCGNLRFGLYGQRVG